jgi:hypothetical protein
MRAPWRINFPILVEPWSREECLILQKEAIKDVRPGVLPSRCWVTGFTRAGRHCRFIVPIEDYDRACRAPAHLVQVDNLQAPAGQLVDPTGRPLLC